MSKKKDTQLLIELALGSRDAILEIVRRGFLQHSLGEDNGWRVPHNFSLLRFQIERDLFEYFKQEQETNI